MKAVRTEKQVRSRRTPKPKDIGQHLAIHPQMCFGRLTFRGTRLPVETIFALLASGKDLEYILKSWPYIPREAIVEAIELASAALVKQTCARPFYLPEDDLNPLSEHPKTAIHEPVHS